MTKLKRHIGWIALAFYGLGDILGAGVYGLVGKAAKEMGNAAWLAFIASMIAAGLTGLSYASIGSRYPKAGGAAYVSFRAFNSTYLSYVIGLVVLASGLTSMATASKVFAGYWNGLMPSLPIPLCIFLFAAFITLIVYRGIKEAMWANILCTCIEVAGLLFIIFVSAKYWGTVDYLSTATPENPLRNLSPSLILSGAVLTFYSFVGFEDILNVSEEVIEPQKNIPRGLLTAVAVSTVIYIAVMISAVSVIPPDILGSSSQPLVEVVRKAAPWFPSSLYSFVAMFAVANTALLNFVMGSRLLYGMSKQKLLPKSLSKVHSKRQTPHVAIVWIATILLGLAFTGDISSLAKATSVLLLSCFCVINVSLIVLQRRKSEAKASFEIPSVVPALGALACLTILSFSKWQELRLALLIAIVVSALFFVMRPSQKEVENAFLEA